MSHNNFSFAIEEYNRAMRENRNRKLRARLARAASREEFYCRLDELANLAAAMKEGKILLTSSPETPIMAGTR